MDMEEYRVLSLWTNVCAVGSYHVAMKEAISNYKDSFWCFRDHVGVF
uniref:Uncharacterized protein n=1 Tax=Rhizophora mucronata TaxID=61149 RepID=A0A2P2R2E0_RHIMU